LGDKRRENRSRVTISCSIFFARSVFSMNIAAWFPTAVMISRSFC